MLYNKNEMIISSIPSAISFAIAGLGLFLLAIKLMSNSLKTMTGGFTMKLLKKFSTNKWLALGFGIIFTTMIQSSDGAVALTIGLISAGFMTLRGAIPFILGANIGTATTSLIVYFGASASFTQYFTILCFVGAMGFLIVKEEKKSNIAMLVFALGAIFLGLKVLSAGMNGVAGTTGFKSFVHGASINPWVAILSSLGLTGAMQSSSATITVVQSLYAGTGSDDSAMALASGIAMIIGANIGTTFTGLIASIGAPKDTKRIALIWLITNITMAIIILPVIGYYADLIDIIVKGTDPNSRRLQLSVSHLLFNGILVSIFIWLVGPLEKVSELLIRNKRKKVPYELQIPDQLIYESPSLAYAAAADSSKEIAKMSRDSILLAQKWIKDNDKNTWKYFNELNNLTDTYKQNLYAYLVKLGSAQITNKISSKHMALVLATRSLDKISSLINAAFKEIKNELKAKTITKDEKEEIKELLNLLISETKRLPRLFTKWSSKTAKEIYSLNDIMEERISEIEKGFIKRNKSKLINFDYISVLKTFSRASHHCARVVNYISNGRKVQTTEEVSKTLRKEIKRSLK